MKKESAKLDWELAEQATEEYLSWPLWKRKAADEAFLTPPQILEKPLDYVMIGEDLSPIEVVSKVLESPSEDWIGPSFSLRRFKGTASVSWSLRKDPMIQLVLLRDKLHLRYGGQKVALVDWKRWQSTLPSLRMGDIKMLPLRIVRIEPSKT